MLKWIQIVKSVSLIPPFFFYASLLSAGLFADIESSLTWFREQDVGGIAGMAALIAVSTLPIGFFISSATVLLLRFVFWLGGRNYETDLSEKELDSIWPLLGTNLGRHTNFDGSNRDEKKTPTDIRRYACATVDHEIIYNNSQGIHEWSARAYTAFSISSNSCLALLLSSAMSVFLRICAPWQWWICSVIVFLLLFAGAFFARRDSLNMSRFQRFRLHTD